MDFSEKWGKDVDDAVELALHDLKLERDQVNITVLEEPSKGFFGIGSKLALVRVERKTASAEKSTEKLSKKQSEKSAEKLEEKQAEKLKDEGFSEAAKAKKQRAKKKNTGRDSKKEAGEITEMPVKLRELEEDSTLDFLVDMTQKMGLNVDVKAYETDDGLYFEVSGPDCGTIIGKRGQTLDSIQYLTSLVANKDREKYIRVIVDAENYRSKREHTLEQLATRLGDKVKKTGKSVKLEPMNPYERKVIHATLQKHSSIVTRSEGEEPYRRVIIERK